MATALKAVVSSVLLTVAISTAASAQATEASSAAMAHSGSLETLCNRGHAGACLRLIVAYEGSGRSDSAAFIRTRLLAPHAEDVGASPSATERARYDVDRQRGELASVRAASNTGGNGIGYCGPVSQPFTGVAQ